MVPQVWGLVLSLRSDSGFGPDMKNPLVAIAFLSGKK